MRQNWLQRNYPELMLGFARAELLGAVCILVLSEGRLRRETALFLGGLAVGSTRAWAFARRQRAAGEHGQ